MRYTDLIQKDGPLAVWSLDENLSTLFGTPSNYRGDYDNGAYYALNDTVSIPVGSPYGIVGSYFIRSGNPGNPGYPPEPGGATNASWTLYSPDAVAKSSVSYGTSTTFDGQYKYNKVENKGLPLVLGGMHASYLKDNGTSPSLVLPRGNAFNQKSTVLPSTIEFWLSINNSTNSEYKIMGVSESSTFGVYVYKNYILLKATDSYFTGIKVDSWAYQKHIAVTYKNDAFYLYVNGEVASFYIEKDALITAGLSSGNFNFYGHDELGYVAIDAPAIYLQEYSSVVAKRHFAYGLAYKVPHNLFSNYGASYQQFEGTYETPINAINIPSTASITNLKFDGIIKTEKGLQLDDGVFVNYTHPSNAATQDAFYFSHEKNNYLDLVNFGRLTDGSGLVGIKLTTTATPSTDQVILDLNEQNKKIQVVYSGTNFYIRQYQQKLANSPTKYAQVTLKTGVSVGTTYRILFGVIDGLYYASIDNVVIDTSSLEAANILTDSVIALVGAQYTGISVLDNYENQLESAKIHFVNIIKNSQEIKYVVDAFGVFADEFDAYYKTGMVYFDKYVKVKKKGYASINIPLETFGKNVFSTVNKKRASQLVIGHSYPKVTNPEVVIKSSLISSSAIIETNHVEELSTINVSGIDDLTGYLLNIDLVIDSQDSSKFPPVLKYISVESRGFDKNEDGVLETRFAGFDKTIELTSNDGLSFIAEKVYSPILLGTFSGINVRGTGVSTTYRSIPANSDPLVNNGLKTISFFARTDSDDNEKIISWTTVAGTTAPTSVGLYVDGVFSSTISFGANKYLTKSQLTLEKYAWKYITLVFNSPMTVVNTAGNFNGPVLTFGDSSGGSDCLIQHLATYSQDINASLINQTYKSFVGNNIISGTVGERVTLSEPVSGVTILQYNWITA